MPKSIGRATAKSFGVKSRFVHFEFFRLTEDQHIGKKGQIVALEVNMRPCGGYSPDMFNFANSTNVYKIWADMVAFDRSYVPVGEHYYCVFVGRRDGKNFVYSHEDILAKYGDRLRLVSRLPDALAQTMGNQVYICNCSTQEEVDEFYYDTQVVND